MGISKRMSNDLRQWNKPVHLTQGGLDRLKTKLERLKKSVPHLVSEAARTAAYGDRSENAEYKDAKSRLRRTYRQIAAIEDQLKRVVLIPATGPTSGARSDGGEIQLGSTVIVESTEGGRKTFQILGPHESDPANGRISNQSPLGAALMGRKKGDTVRIQGARGEMEYKVVEVL